VLEAGRAVGYLGPGPVEAQIAHARALGRVVDDWSGRALDLGSGGGLPGLVLAVAHPQSRWLLLDAHGGRTTFLRRAVADLDLSGRVTVVRARAEEAGRQSELREMFAVVTARGFGPPGVTAECAAALVSIGGRVVVSEPPDPDSGRWPADGLARLGLWRLPQRDDGSAPLVVLHKRKACPAWAPRRVGLPAKRPLF
jgi:16S rRNA (guanine527-N7)-methyltransferase